MDVISLEQHLAAALYGYGGQCEKTALEFVNLGATSAGGLIC